MQISDSIATLKNASDFITSIQSQAIVKPDNFKGIAGFAFDITENDAINLQSDITDHFIEDNSAINDHIALKPETVTVSGFTGELIKRQPLAIKNIPVIGDKLSIISEYIPEISVPIQQLYSTLNDVIDTVSEVTKGVEDLYSLFSNNNTEDKDTNQAKAFSFFYSLWLAREVFTIDTPFKVFTNMAIENMEVLQSDSVSISEFNITFKKLRFSKAIVINTNQGRRINQILDTLNKGNLRGEIKADSLLIQAAEGLGVSL